MQDVILKMPNILISKEALMYMSDSLEINQMGIIMNALCEYLINGVIPSFETKGENAMWNKLMRDIELGAKKYQASVNNGKKGGESGKLGGRPRKGETKEEYQARKAAQIEPNTNFENEPVDNTPTFDFKPIPEPLQPFIEQDSIPVPEKSYNGLKEAEIEIIESRVDDFVRGYEFHKKSPMKVDAYKAALERAGIDKEKWQLVLQYTGELIKQRESNSMVVDEYGRTFNVVG